ncbi:MAG: PIN domain-containing protein, partial [Bdellovibrionales bacterium]
MKEATYGPHHARGVGMQFPSHCDRKVIIDTNVILFDALAINKFKAADIYIPFSVIEEIDRFKRDLGENGR